MLRADAHGRQDVARPVGAELVTGAHGCRETDRLVAFQGKIEEIGAFFQTVRAVGDDAAADVVHGQILPDHGRQAEHVVRGDGRARQVVELAYFQIADAAQAGDGPDKVRTADSGHGRTGHAVMLHGDGAAGSDDDDF